MSKTTTPQEELHGVKLKRTQLSQDLFSYIHMEYIVFPVKD